MQVDKFMTPARWNHTIDCDKEISQVIADKIGCNIALIFSDFSCEVHSLWKELHLLSIPHTSFLTFVHNDFFFGLEDESTSSVIISLSTSSVFTDVTAWASESFLPLEIEINGLAQLAGAGMDLSILKTNNTLPFKCELVSSSGHLLALTSAETFQVYLFSVKRHRSTLRLRLHQIIGPLTGPLSSIAVTPTHIVACEANAIKLWEVKPIEAPKPNDRTPIKKSMSKKEKEKEKEKEREKEKEKEIHIDTGVELSSLHCLTPIFLIGTTKSGEVYALSISLLTNPSVPPERAVPVFLRAEFPCKVMKYAILPPSPRYEQASPSGTLICASNQFTVHLFPLDEVVKFMLAKEESIIEETATPAQAALTPKQSLLLSAPVTHVCFVPFDTLVAVCENSTLQVHLL
eukprot:Phypoly_transcript_07194.p1 GENE.Phypoly_transcript_07194~~Phypoly_transcript_07194.p1  ORF type:complete len:403 (+),score=56.45 Phypoly_transcript_07194:198-1406(+)